MRVVMGWRRTVDGEGLVGVRFVMQIVYGDMGPFDLQMSISKPTVTIKNHNLLVILALTFDSRYL
jgi:hypothetical protein